MHVVKVDYLDTETFQTRVKRLPHMFGIIVQPLIRIPGDANLGCDRKRIFASTGS